MSKELERVILAIEHLNQEMKSLRDILLSIQADEQEKKAQSKRPKLIAGTDTEK